MAAMKCLISTNISSHSMHKIPSFSSTSCKLMCSGVAPTSTTPIRINSSLQSTIPISPKLKQQQLRKVDLEYTKTNEELREKTRGTLQKALDPMAAMKLIDTLQWLGISYHYEEEIDFWLGKLSQWDADDDDLHATALRFRLLRQNARPVSSDVFKKFRVNGKFRKSISEDKEGLLNLYEASCLGTNGEDILSEAAKFTENELKLSSANGILPKHISRRVGRALELPRHMRMERLESRLYIDEYNIQENHSLLLLEQAKADYNEVQLLYQSELAEMSRWWKQLGLVEKLTFARDRPMECFLWTVGIFPEPKYSSLRVDLAKTVAILLVIDDIFDTYGTINELSLFKSAIQRWDLNAIEQLPQYMKICYMALYNTTNEIAYKVLREQGRNILPFLEKAWIDAIEAFMIEAEWFNNGHTPRVEDYLENGVTTSGAYMALVHAFFLMGEGLTIENVKLMAKPYPKLFSNSGRILRLWDDLGTAKEEQEKGDNASSISLLMKEKNMVHEDEARAYTMKLIHNLWKDLNTELLGSNILPLPIIRACFNMSRTSQVIYQHQEDSYFSSVDKFVDLILFKPIA
ncbi:Geranyl diphosphate diphosphatase [Handroanthus impetiginosus]|uniref:Geranyl diphosphate diphosphatase n=1 Tax=Handroanthus impetiginosus TaxID=429701 RepID=A0A2G9GUH6_9LAMI|nr:Geranyl diphosphate diphosphatase [Handroanthus impetiginosus]